MRRADLLAQLSAVAVDTGALLDVGTGSEQLTDLCAAARVAFGAVAASLARVEGEHLRYVAASGVGAEAIVDTTLTLDRGLAGYVAVSGQALAIDDPAADPRFARDVAERTGHVPQTLLLVPVPGPEGTTAGVITVLDRTIGTADALELGTAFARLASPLLAALSETATTARVLIDAFTDAVTTSAPELAPSLRRALGRLPDADADVVAIATALNGVRRLDAAARQRVLAVVEAVVELAGRRRGG